MGGLSGCTFEEAKSWGKIEKGSAYAAVYMDATVALPLIVGAILPGEEDLRTEKEAPFSYGKVDRLKSLQFI